MRVWPLGETARDSRRVVLPLFSPVPEMRWVLVRAEVVVGVALVFGWERQMQIPRRSRECGTQTARWKAAVRGKRQRRRPEASGTRDKSKKPAGCRRYKGKVKDARRRPAVRGKSQRRRPEASGTEAAGTSKTPARRRRYEGEVKGAGWKPAVRKSPAISMGARVAAASA